MLAEKFPRRPMRSLVTIKRDGARQSALALERPPEKRLGNDRGLFGPLRKLFDIEDGSRKSRRVFNADVLYFPSTDLTRANEELSASHQIARKIYNESRLRRW
jgi:hypothetical protein